MPTRAVALATSAVVALAPFVAIAATIAPPMLDITRQCDASTRHNVRAMSECVVAESEARSEILQKWDRLSDDSAQKCLKIGRKSRQFPYSTIAKCLAVEPVVLPSASAAIPAAASPSADTPPATGAATSTLSGWRHFFSSGK